MKILIVKPSSLGDIVHGLLVATAIKDSIAAVSIDWVVRDCFAEIIGASGLVDRIMKFHRNGGLLKFIELIGEIRQCRYDYVFDMQGLARSATMTYFARGDRKIGRSDCREFSWLAYDKKICFPWKNPPHAVEILLQFLPEIGLPAQLTNGLKLFPKVSQFVAYSFASCCDSRSGVIILCPESRRSEKEWPHFQQLAEELARVFPSHGVLIIGRKKLDLRFPCGDVCNLTGSTSIGDVAWLIERAAAVVSNDSAPMHLAAAMNVPVVALFGPTDPAKFGPYAMQRVNSCAKNVKHSVIRADGGRMQSIQLGAVVDAIGISLDANGQPSPVAQSTRNGENSAS